MLNIDVQVVASFGKQTNDNLPEVDLMKFVSIVL